MSVAEKLDRHIATMVANDSKAIADVARVANLSRILLEQSPWKAHSRTLGLYLDWAHHAHLDRNPTGFAVLEKLDDICVTMGSHPVEEFIWAVSNALSLEELRSEFIRLFLAEGIRTILFDPRPNWLEVSGVLLEDLIDRKVKFPDNVRTAKGPARIVFDRMLAKRAANSAPTDRAVDTLFLTKLPPDEAKEGRPAGIYWNLMWGARPRRWLDGPILVLK